MVKTAKAIYLSPHNFFFLVDILTGYSVGKGYFFDDYIARHLPSFPLIRVFLEFIIPHAVLERTRRKTFCVFKATFSFRQDSLRPWQEGLFPQDLSISLVLQALQYIY